MVRVLFRSFARGRCRARGRTDPGGDAGILLVAVGWWVGAGSRFNPLFDFRIQECGADVDVVEWPVVFQGCQ